MAAVSTEHAETYKRVHPVDFVHQFLAHAVRSDGRQLDQSRKVTLAMGTIGTADSSAVVRLGTTSVVCGIKLEFANPPVDRPDHGWLVVNCTMSGLCAAHLGNGPPPEQAQMLSHFLQTTLVKAGVIDLKDLCIKPAKLAWCLYVDAVCLNDDGNVIDAAWLAVVAALQHLRLPALSAFGPSADAASDDDNDSSDGAMDMSNDTGSALPTIVDGAGTPLKLGPVPVAVSFALLEGTVDGKPAVHVLSDPSIEEEAAMQSSVTVVAHRDGRLAAVSKPSPGGNPSLLPGGLRVSQHQLRECISRATARAGRVTELLAKTPRA